MSGQQGAHQGRKHRRSLLSLPLLPTITETLEDPPSHPSACQSPQRSQTQDDYMSSIQALARPAEVLNCGPRRLQRSPRLKQVSKMKSSLPRASPRALRTSSLKDSEEFDCRGKDPLDWLYGQIHT
ncbi:protein DEPP-like [Synchiropus splendidus]|uniref:protein DEPP-like n=1 Tax=Synchiropus splendidus TaxID=270530 RepID=UPI00237E19A9|nr:protein DEPP-like [Synchiropus splendidus]